MASSRGFEALTRLRDIQDHRFTRFRRGAMELAYRPGTGDWEIRRNVAWVMAFVRSTALGFQIEVVDEHPDVEFWSFCDKTMEFLRARQELLREAG